MKIKGLKEYINTFDKDKEIAIIVADTQKRIAHKVKMAYFVAEEPAIILEVDGTEPLDEVVERIESEGLK
jgi:hypothetical protein